MCASTRESQCLAEARRALAPTNLSSLGGHGNLSLIEETALELLLPSCVTLSKLLSFSELLHWENMATSNTCPVHPQGCFANCKVDPTVQGGSPEPVGPGSTRPFRWEPSLGLAAALVGGAVHPVWVIVCVWSGPCPSCTCSLLDSQQRPQDGRESMGKATLMGEAALVKGTPCTLGEQGKTDPREKSSQAFPDSRPPGPQGSPRGGRWRCC